MLHMYYSKKVWSHQFVNWQGFENDYEILLKSYHKPYITKCHISSIFHYQICIVEEIKRVSIFRMMFVKYKVSGALCKVLTNA